MKAGSRIRRIAWLAVAVLALGYLAASTQWGAFRESLANIQWWWAFWAVFLYLLAQTLLASRWVYLLKVHGVFVSSFQAIKLTYLGLFYNNFMPGAVGGDLLKGWFITHHCREDQRVEAAVTVFVDRLVGLIGMIIVAMITSLFTGGEIAIDVGGRSFQIRWIVWGIFTLMVGGACIFLSRRVRRGLMLNRILERLPFSNLLKQVDQAIRIYRHHLGVMGICLVLTAFIQGAAIVAIWMLTQALQFEQVSFWQCLILMPIIWVISSAIPVPGGFGVIENAVKYLFCLVINPLAPQQAMGQAVALAVLIRALICVCSLPGLLVPIFGGHLPKTKELRDEFHSGQSDAE